MSEIQSLKQGNASRDGFVNLTISLNSIAPFGSLAPSALALLFCFSLIERSLSIVTTWNQQYMSEIFDIYIYRTKTVAVLEKISDICVGRIPP